MEHNYGKAFVYNVENPYSTTRTAKVSKYNAQIMYHLQSIIYLKLNIISLKINFESNKYVQDLYAIQ